MLDLTRHIDPLMALIGDLNEINLRGEPCEGVSQALDDAVRLENWICRTVAEASTQVRKASAP